MPDDQINKRMNYFDRQFLRAADFQVEQKYHIDRHRRHNRLLHTAGLGGPNDLLVSGAKGQAQVTVSAGTAIDPDGCEIVLPASAPPLDLTEIPEAGKYAIYVELEEKPTDPSTDPGIEGATRITEKPKFRFQKLVTDPPEYPPLTLAAITVDEDKTLTEDPDISMRKLAGTSAGFTGTFAAITASSLTLLREGQSAVQLESSGLMRSPMWQVRLSLNAKSTRLVAANQPILTPPTAHTAQFDSLGGTLLIFASISVLPVPPGNIGFDDDFIVGVNILLDNIKIPDPNNQAPSVPGCARKTGVSASGPLITPHMTVTTTLAISNIQKKEDHTLLLRTADSTMLRENDFYSVTILELPF